MKIVVGLEMVVGIDNKAAGDPVPAGDLRERGVAGRQRLPPGLGQDAFAGMVHAPARDGRQSFRRDVRKDHALLGELVKMRCLDAPAAVAAHVVGPECVGDDNDDVQAAELARTGGRSKSARPHGRFFGGLLGASRRAAGQRRGARRRHRADKRSPTDRFGLLACRRDGFLGSILIFLRHHDLPGYQGSGTVLCRPPQRRLRCGPEDAGGVASSHGHGATKVRADTGPWSPEVMPRFYRPCNRMSIKVSEVQHAFPRER